MKERIICFGVRDYEVEYFKKLGEKYDYELVLSKEYLNNQNYELALGYKIIMIRGNCILDKEHLKILKDNGLKYYLTRTAGYNHVDLNALKELGIECAYVPGYSPNAISELALTFAMSLLRNFAYTCNQTHNGNFKVTSNMFSKEIRGCVVGIIGCGRIGITSARLFKGIGAKVIGYDIYESDEAKKIINFVSLEKLLEKSDIVIIHMSYKKGVNDNFIDKEKINRMKKGAILINVSRGEVLDLEYAIQKVKEGYLSGIGIDVISNETTLFNKVFDPNKMDTKLHQDLIDLYPKVLVTPHIGSATDLALIDMIEISLKNMDEYLTTGKCQNSLIK